MLVSKYYFFIFCDYNPRCSTMFFFSFSFVSTAYQVLAPPTTRGLEPGGLCFCSSFKSPVHHCMHATPRSTELTSADHSPFICEASHCEKTSHRGKVHFEWGNEKARTCSETTGTPASVSESWPNLRYMFHLKIIHKTLALNFNLDV